MALWTKAGERGVVLLKLAREKKHLEMLRHGLLYMNPLNYFRLSEGDAARGDNREGDDYILQPQHARVLIDTKVPGIGQISATPGDLAGPVRIARDRTRSCNLFCLFAITSPLEHPTFPPRYCWPGDYFVLFAHTQEFLSRVVSSAQGRGLQSECGLVEYYDESRYSGQLGRFQKPIRFSYQSEYRIAMEPGSIEAIQLQVPDLSNITSEVFPLDRADDVLKFNAKELEAAGISWD
jgi:hypothetical protein